MNPIAQPSNIDNAPPATTPSRPKRRTRRSWARLGCALAILLGIISLGNTGLGIGAMLALGTLDDVGLE